MPRRSVRPWHLLPLLQLLLACAPGAPAPAPPWLGGDSGDWAAAQMEETRALPVLRFEIIEGDATSRVEARMEEGVPVVMVVALELGEYGQGQVHLHFHQGALLRYHETGERRLVDPDDPSRLVPLEFLILFNSDGSVAGAVRTEGGADVPADPLVVEGAVAHAERLRAEVARIQGGG